MIESLTVDPSRRDTAPRWPVALATCLLLSLAFVAGFVRDFSGDFHWHVVQGAWMLDHGAILHSDVFSSTVRGQHEYADEWLGDVLLAIAFRAGSYPACYALRGVALALTFGLLAREMTRLGIGRVVAATLLAPVLGELLFRFYLRPETLTFPLFAAIIALLGEHERTGERKHLLYVLPLLALWSNLHASVLVGIVVASTYAIAQAVLSIWSDTTERKERVLTGALFLVFSVLASMVNPQGAREPLMFLFVRKDDPTYSAGVEWLPLDIETLSIAFPAMALAAAALTLLAGRKASLWRATVAIGFFALALLHGRFVKIFLLALGPLVASDLAAVRAALAGDRAEVWSRVGRVLLAATALGSFVLLFVVRRLQREIGLGLDPGVYPESACRFARSAPLDGKMFNSFDIGSYLMFCLPGHPVFIDQRAAQLYPPEFSRAYYAARRDSHSARAYTDAMGVDWAFVVYRDAFAWDFAQDPSAWTLVYFDDQALLYVRNGRSAARGWDGQAFHQLDPLHPWRVPFLYGGEIEEARGELARLSKRCPDCAWTHTMRALEALGRHDLEAFGAEGARAEQASTSAALVMTALASFARGKAEPAERALGALASQMPYEEWLDVAAEAHAWAGDFATAERVLAQRADLAGPGKSASRARDYVEAARAR
jgi:hypothetical protein